MNTAVAAFLTVVCAILAIIVETANTEPIAFMVATLCFGVVTLVGAINDAG